MSLIYEPKGKAREYSPLALNIYNGCSHRCKYCYLRNFSAFLSAPFPTEKKNLLENLEKELSRKEIFDQVLLSFVSDIYCEGATITRDVLKLLIKYQVPTAILTKNKSVVNDIDLFEQFDALKIGMTLTFTDAEKSKYYEPGASIPAERFEALRTLHGLGFRTFASLEPVIEPEESLEVIEKTHSYIDLYKIGKLNNISFGKKIDWKQFGNLAIERCQKYKKDFYIKKDLLDFVGTERLKPENFSPDFWALKK
jgi:DNA repair photolyase